MIKTTHQQSTPQRIEYQIYTPKKSYSVYFSSDQVTLLPGGDTEAILALLAAAKLRQRLRLSTAISSELANNLQHWLRVMANWYPQYHPVDIQPVALTTPVAPSGRVGSLFTGGVDSFYTFLKHRAIITDLIYIHGYDVKLADHERRNEITQMGRAIASASGVRFIELETNAIRVFRDYGHWGSQSHGAGLACAARHLQGHLDILYIPSSFPNAKLIPWGSHPATDPLFSDQNLTLIHDGCEATRTEKIAAIATNPLAQQYLRVCWTNVAGTYNCGVCEKCLRTQTTLYALGRLGEFKTFNNDLSPATIAKLALSGASALSFCEDNLALLADNQLTNTDIYRAWQQQAEHAQIQTQPLLQRLFNKIVARLSTP